MPIGRKPCFLQFVTIIMTPAIQLTQLIEDLSPGDREKVEEYIQLLHSKEYIISPSESLLDEKYRDYILQGITEAEEAYSHGEYYTVPEGRKRLIELLAR